MLTTRKTQFLERVWPVNRLSAAVIYWTVGAVAFALWGGPPGTWRATHWLFTFQNGIPRRALPGSLLSLTGELSMSRITIASIGIYVVAVALLGWALSGLAAGSGRRFLAVLILLVSPVGFPFLAANIGRFDTILVILGVVAVWLINSRRYTFVFVVVAVMVLVHEAASVLVVAWLAALLAHSRKSKPALGALIVGSAVAGAMILWTPPVPPLEMSDRIATDFPVDRRSLLVLYTHASVNIQLGLSFLLSAAGARWLFKVVASSGAVIVTGSRLRDPWLLAGSLAPLTLVPLATDYERWVAFSSGLLVVSLAIHGRRFHSERVLLALTVVSFAVTAAVGGGLVFDASEIWGPSP